MKAWCLELDGRQDKDECAKPTIGRARNLSNGNVAVFFMVRFQEKEMRGWKKGLKSGIGNKEYGWGAVSNGVKCSYRLFRQIQK
jgi:hypothetical protein